MNLPQFLIAEKYNYSSIKQLKIKKILVANVIFTTYPGKVLQQFKLIRG